MKSIRNLMLIKLTILVPIMIVFNNNNFSNCNFNFLTESNYYTSNEWKLNSNKNNLFNFNIININIRSLKKNFDKLIMFLNTMIILI